jgi:hypothetical protein
MESYREPGGYDIYKNDDSILSDDIKNFEIDTRKNFWETLEQHMNTRYNLCAEAISDWESGRYLRVGPGMAMNELLERLEEWYTSVIAVHRVPTLLSLTQRVLFQRPLLAKALMEHQRNHGYQRTEDAVHIYFDITS